MLMINRSLFRGASYFLHFAVCGINFCTCTSVIWWMVNPFAVSSWFFFRLFLYIFQSGIRNEIWKKKTGNGFKNAIAASTWALYKEYRRASLYAIHTFVQIKKIKEKKIQTCVLNCLTFVSFKKIRNDNEFRFLVKKGLPRISYHLIDSLNSISYLHHSYKDQLYIIIVERSEWNASHYDRQYTNENENENNYIFDEIII